MEASPGWKISQLAWLFPRFFMLLAGMLPNCMNSTAKIRIKYKTRFSRVTFVCVEEACNNCREKEKGEKDTGSTTPPPKFIERISSWCIDK